MRERGDCKPLMFDVSDVKSISQTRQSFAKEADINVIMSRYAVSGVLVDPRNVDSARVARFGDFSDITDYAHLVARIRQADEDFMTLSSDVRAKFNNSVEDCLSWISQPEHVVEAVKLGLLPETMIEATYLVRPDLRPPKEVPKEGPAPKETATPKTA